MRYLRRKTLLKWHFGTVLTDLDVTVWDVPVGLQRFPTCTLEFTKEKTKK
jgi:hypothetical protein